jgi:hypothetical protein
LKDLRQNAGVSCEEKNQPNHGDARATLKEQDALALIMILMKSMP